MRDSAHRTNWRAGKQSARNVRLRSTCLRHPRARGARSRLRCLRRRSASPEDERRSPQSIIRTRTFAIAAILLAIAAASAAGYLIGRSHPQTPTSDDNTSASIAMRDDKQLKPIDTGNVVPLAAHRAVGTEAKPVGTESRPAPSATGPASASKTQHLAVDATPRNSATASITAAGPEKV